MDTVELAKRIRINSLKMVHWGNSSHIGSVLSMCDILAVLYGQVMKVRPKQPNWSARDRFILSKGHAGAGVYACLAELGFFSKDLLKQHYQNGSLFSGHVSHKGIPGVELSTGSLGHGLPVAVGMALAASVNKQDHRVFVLMGDGELAEGSNWEAMLFANHHQLKNLTIIIDRNNLQSIDTTENTLALEPLSDKFKSFGMEVHEVAGHNHQSMKELFLKPASTPRVVVANTTKGKGVSFMENSVAWHYKSPNQDLLHQAISELEGQS